MSSATPIKQNSKQNTISSTPKNPSLSISETPDKTVPKPRSRRGNVAMSVSEVRRSARNIRSAASSSMRSTPRAAKRQILIPESPVRKPKNPAANVAEKLPEKYENLAEFFESLDSSIRLLRLRNSKTSFSNLCLQVQNMTDKSFSYSHLAQMKFLLPEAFELKKIQSFDEKTCSMKPELLVLLDLEFLKDGGKFKGESLNMELRKLFRTRLMEFVKSHPEGDEVPEDTLPEPFNPKQKQSDVARPHVSRVIPIAAVADEQPIVATHVPKTFRRFFSQRFSCKEIEKTLSNEIESSVKQSVPSNSWTLFNKVSSVEEKRSAVTSPVKSVVENSIGDDFSAPTAPAISLQSFNSPVPQSKAIDFIKSTDHSPASTVSNQSTPAKLALTPARLMTRTPSVKPTKRSGISSDDDSKCSINKLARRPPLNRPLKFDDDLDDLLPADVLESIREREKKAKELQDPAISQAKKRKQMIANLPKLSNMIRYIFNSVSRSVLTKTELMHKLIASHLDVTEKKEVEEQLDLLLELVPDWISQKMASTGDLLMSINKKFNVDSIRQQLGQAV